MCLSKILTGLDEDAILSKEPNKKCVSVCFCVYVRVCGACVHANVRFARQVDCFYTVKIHLNFYVVQGLYTGLEYVIGLYSFVLNLKECSK